MTAPTVPVTIKLADFGGPARAGITITARLDQIDYTADGTFVGTKAVTAVTDATGTAVLQVFPNATVANGGLGTVGTVIRFTAGISGSRSLDVTGVIPNAPCNLVDYVVSNEPLGLSGSEGAAARAQAARDTAEADALQTAADRVQTGLDRVATGADRAAVAADRTLADSSAATASTAATSASGSANAAAASAASASSVSVAAGAYPNSGATVVPAGVALNANYWVTSADGKSLDSYKNVGGVATRDTTIASLVAYPAVADEVLKTTGSLGDAYVLAAAVATGSTTPNTVSYPATFTDTLFPSAATVARGYLQDFSVRMSAAGTGQIIVMVPDAMSPADYDVVAVVAVAPGAAGVNTFSGSTIYTGELPAGSRVGYRWLTGGTVRMVSGGGTDKKISGTAQVAGSAMAGDLLTGADQYAVAFSTRPIAVSSLDSRVAKAEAGTNTFGIDLAATLGTNVTGANSTTGNTALAATATLPTGNWVFALTPVAQDCILQSVTLPLANPLASTDGTLVDVRIAVGQMNLAGAVVVSNLYAVKAAVGRTNVISGFGALVVPAGSFVMVQPASAVGPLNYKAGLGNGVDKSYSVDHAAPLTLGAAVQLAAYTETPIFSFTVRTTAAGRLSPRLAKAEALQALQIAGSDPVPLERAKFDGALPTGWTASGAWLSFGGLNPPGVGGWGVKCLSGSYTALWKHVQAARIRIASIDTITGIAQSPPENSGGAALLIDGVASKLRLYAWDDTGAAGTLTAEVALPAALVAGREYILKLEKNGFTLTGTLRDTVTQQSCTVTVDGTASYVMGHGKCGALFISATSVPTYQWIEYLAPYPRKCRALIVADSIGEGAYLGAANPTWVRQVANARATQNDIVTAPRAGDETPNFLLRKSYDWDIWLPQFAIIALGTNDTTQSIWRTNVATLIAKAEALGAEPVLCTQVPRVGSQALRTAMNDDIRNGYFGRYRYIDMASAVSLNNDRVTWNPAFNSGDDIHPNAAGQNAMFAQAQVDLPGLFT